jgi:predicted RNA-binding Zn-ribbon protein involved in translation (DUF1610 family)
MKTNCPRCGTVLIKEKTESPNFIRVDSKRYKGGSLDILEGSIDTFLTCDYVYRCPKCGYLTSDC